VNVFAAWRLVLLFQARTNIKAILDGTYKGVIAILLSSLETNLASICASVPVFWPVLTKQIANIFVTKEIEMHFEERYELPSRSASTVELAGSTQHWKDSSSHYNDTYIRDQVDPLRPNTSTGVETMVTGEGAAPKKKRYVF
jgi:hypothetical protein